MVSQGPRALVLDLRAKLYCVVDLSRLCSSTGERADYWVRVTSGFQKMNDQWMITHEHVSVPINMQTMQAALDLQP